MDEYVNINELVTAAKTFALSRHGLVRLWLTSRDVRPLFVRQAQRQPRT